MIYIYIIYIYIYTYISYTYNPCFNLFRLHNNSFDDQESEINKNDIFYVLTNLLRFWL